ncbi:MAG: cation:proton antiporter [Pseudomonadota bacterium]
MQGFWIKDAFVYLVAAGVLVPLLQRARIGAVVGFILIGALVGPHGLGLLADQLPFIRYVTISDAHQVAIVGEVGIIFLLFLLGLEFSAARLWALRREVFGVGLLQVAFCGAALALAGVVSGGHAGPALVIGFALAMSSTAVVMQLLSTSRRVQSPLGRGALAILLFQDLMVVPILLAAQILGTQDADVLQLVGLAAAKSVAAIAVILIAGRYVLAPLVEAAAGTGARDLIMAISFVVVAGTAGLTHAAGLSSALGAFLGGMMLSGTAYRHQIGVDLEPFKGLLIGVFFVSVGMGVDLGSVLPRLHVVLLGVAVLVAVKVAMTYLAARLFSVARPLAGELSLLLAQTGEFAFVVLGLLSATGVVPADEISVLVSIVTLSLVFTPVMARLGRLLYGVLERHERRDDLAPAAAPVSGHVVIGGFGRVGRIIAETLETEGVPFVALDADPSCVRAEQAAGRQVFLGDASRAEMLERVNLDGACAFVVTLDAAEPADRMVRAIKHHRPDALILARVKDAAHARALSALGVSQVIPETVEASLQLCAHLLLALGLKEDEVQTRIDAAREKERGRIEMGADR